MSIWVPSRWVSTPEVNGERCPDTMEVYIDVQFRRPCTLWRGEWHVTLPEGLEHVGGKLAGSGLTSEIRGRHVVRARRSRWGEFQIRGSFKTGVDSLNWTSHDIVVEAHCSPGQYSFHHNPPPDFGILNRKHVLGGVHHREMLSAWLWLPLDPGEDEPVEHGFDMRLHKSPVPARYKQTSRFASAATSDSSVQVPIIVAVSRDGLVKDTYTPNLGVPRAILDSAVVAARKWRFEPAVSLGRPVSALYTIKVPVQVPADVYADLRKRNRLP